jgi:hypothetical protein
MHTAGRKHRQDAQVVHRVEFIRLGRVLILFNSSRDQRSLPDRQSVADPCNFSGYCGVVSGMCCHMPLYAKAIS